MSEQELDWQIVQRVQQGDRAVHEQKTKQKKLSAELMS